MQPTIRSLRQEQRELSTQERAKYKTWVEISKLFVQRYHVNMRVALRLVRGWSQREAADQWNERWPAEPKTFKNFSYWELWPSSTGHSPSLDVLGKLAELYECSVADLVSDCADFRTADKIHRDNHRLSRFTTEVSASTPVEVIVARLEAVDVDELSHIAASWAASGPNSLSRRSLLLKLSAGLTLAAATPAFAEAAPTDPTTDDPSNTGHLSGIWHSRYVYSSTGRGKDFVGEHYVVIRQQDSALAGHSVPADNGSLLKLDLRIGGTVATGTWSERTSPDGYYRGSTYHGALQLVIDPMGKSMRGRWVGFDREFNVRSDTWELHWVESATTAHARRKYHLKV